MARDLKREREIALAVRGDGPLRPYKSRTPKEPPRRSTSTDTRRWLRVAEADLVERAEAERLLERPLDDNDWLEYSYDQAE